jgi:hypothetical protein
MSEEKNLFFPVFYNALEITQSLSNEEFGSIVRELLASGGKKSYEPNLHAHLKIIYNFMLDGAIRVFAGAHDKSRWQKERKKPKDVLFRGEDDPDEILRKALERTYSGMAT